MQYLRYGPDVGQMRARLQVYAALSDFRHREDGVQAFKPSSVDQIPA